jgi:hypothetical protein
MQVHFEQPTLKFGQGNGISQATAQGISRRRISVAGRVLLLFVAVAGNTSLHRRLIHHAAIVPSKKAAASHSPGC